MAIQIKIFSTNGDLVYDVQYNDRMVGEYQFIWEGTSATGRQVSAGSYICVINVANDRGNFEMSNKMLVIRN